MGGAQQFGLILWKNLVLRIRQPGILFLELVWPILIFVIVALVRLGSPPVDSKGCYYAPRSMPSAGGVNFLQSFACNLDNKCYPNESSAKKSNDNPRIKEFLKSTQPLFNNTENASNMLRELPDAIRVVNKLQDVLKDPAVQSIVNQKLTLGALLIDRSRVRKKLVEEMAVLPGDVVDALLDSTINITKLYDLTGQIDFKKLVCDSEELGSYLFLDRGPVDAKELSRQLCKLDSDKIPDIVKVLQNQIDIGAIVKMIAEVKKFVGVYDDATLLEDIGTMMSLIRNSSIAQMLLGKTGILDLKDSVGWVFQVVKFVDGLVRSNGNGSLDITSLQQIFEKLDPVINTLAGNASWWVDLRKNFNQIYAVLGWFQNISPKLSDIKVTLSQVFGENSELNLWMKTNLNLTDSALKGLAGLEIDMQKYTDLISRVSQPGAPIRKLLCEAPGIVSIYKTKKKKVPTATLR